VSESEQRPRAGSQVNESRDSHEKEWRIALSPGAHCSKSNSHPPESVIRAAHDGHVTARKYFVVNALGQRRFGELLATILGDGYRSARH
jgi:erythromycin esterase-like protein